MRNKYLSPSADGQLKWVYTEVVKTSCRNKLPAEQLQRMSAIVIIGQTFEEVY